MVEFVTWEVDTESLLIIVVFVAVIIVPLFLDRDLAIAAISPRVVTDEDSASLTLCLPNRGVTPAVRLVSVNGLLVYLSFFLCEVRCGISVAVVAYWCVVRCDCCRFA